MQDITRILILENLPSDYELAQREILKEIPDCQFEREDGQIGFLNAVQNFEPDLIVSEYKLQTLDVLRVLALLRERSANIPVIVLSRALDGETAVECIKAGAVDYVRKANRQRLGPAVVQAMETQKLLLEKNSAEEIVRSLSRFPEENPDPVLRAAPDGQVMYANPAGQRLLYKWECTPGGYLRADWQEIVAEVYQSNRKRSVVVPIGEETFSIQIVPFREAGYANLYGHEITEAVQAEHDLRESEKRYRTLFEDMPVAVFEEDFSDVKKYLDHLKDQGITDFRAYLDSHPRAIIECARLIRILDINKAGGQMYGVASEKALFTSFQKDLTREEMELLKEGFIAIAEGKTKAYWEGADTNAAGESIVTSVCSSVVRGHETDYSRVIISTTNITERKQTEEELRRQTQTMTALYDITRDLVIERDLSRLLHTIVERATQLLSAGGGGLYLCEPEQAQIRCEVSYQTPRDFTGTVLRYGEGAAGRVAQTGKPLIIDDYSTWDGRAQAYDDQRYFDAVLSVPIKWQDQVLGVLHALSYDGERRFHESDLTLLVSFANQAAIAIQNAKLHVQLEHQIHVHEALQEATLPLLRELDTSEALELIILQAAQLLKTAHGFIYMVEPNGSEIELRAAVGIFTEYIGSRLKAGEGVGGTVWQTGEALIVQDYHTWTGRSMHFEEAEFKSVIGVPLVSGSRITGVLGLAHLESSRAYGSYDQELLNSFAQLASIALENARLYTSSQQELVERKQVQEALLKSERKAKALLNALPDMMFRMDREGNFLDYKAEPSDLYAQSEPTLINKNLRETAPAEFAELVDWYIRQTLASGEMQVFEYQLPIPQRGLRNYEARMVASGRDEVIAIVRDITDHKRAEQELRQSEERFRQLANNIQAVFWMTDAETGREIYISPAGEKIWGRPLDYLLHEKDAFIECVLEEDRRYVLNSLQEQRMGKRADLEYRVLHLDGSIHWIWDRAFPILDENGKLKILAGIAADVTERKRTEGALRESEERFANAFEFAPIGIALVSPEGAFLKVNNALSHILGYTQQELLSKTFQEITHADDLETDLHFVKQMLAGERIRYQMEKRYFHKAGQIIWVVLSVSLVKDSEDKPLFFISQIQDITERKQAEEEIRRQAKETAALLKASMALTHLDLRAILQSIGSSAKSLFQADGCRIFITEADGQSLRCVLALQENAGSLPNLRLKLGEGVTGAVAASGQAEIVNEMHKDPRAVQIPGTSDEEEEAIMFAPLKQQDRTIGILSVRRAGVEHPFMPGDLDLLEAFASMAASAVSNARLFEEAQRQLSELEALYENGLTVAQLLEPRQIGACFIQTFARHLSWHHVTIRLLNPATDELELIAFNQPGLKDEEKPERERHFNQMVRQSRQGLSGWVTQTGVSLRTGNVHAYTQYVDTQPGIQSGLYMPLKIGERVIGVISVESEMPDAFTEQDDRLLATFGNQAAVAFENARLYQTVQDELLERKRMEEALEEERNQLARRVVERTADLSRANSNLARALRVKDEFLANMSHELRTPLNAILGLSESLNEQVAGPLNEKQQRYLSTINESGHHLLSLINDILDLAKVEAGQITLDISKVHIKSVCEASLRMIKQLAQKKNQEVLFEIDDELDLMWADERRIKQMIVNLLSNAVKFTPEAATLGLEVHGDRSGNRVLITVWDKGIGISETDLERLFKPFVQLDSGLEREATGTGLGLVLVAQMARLHGGSVSVESQPGEGSRFIIRLPWEPALAPDSSIRLKSTGKFKAIDPQTKNNPTILLIEDTREVVMMLVDYLEMTGFKIVTAQDGVEGLEKAKLTHPDLILMDIQMPRMNGFETTQTLRMDPEFKNTPIIALTALAMPNDRQRCLEAGMDEYISKPVNLQALVKLIQNILLKNAESQPK